MRIKLLAIAAAVAAFSANAAVENTFSVGANAGWTHAYEHNFASRNLDKKNGYQLGLNGEYNFTDWFALGTEYAYQNGLKIDDDAKLHTNALGLYSRFAFPFDNNGSDIFFKAGVDYVVSKYNGETSKKRFAPVLGVGAQYALTSSMAIRAGYDFKFGTTKVADQEKINNGTAYVGFQYNFGAPQQAPVVAPAAKKTVHVTKNHTLAAGLLFPFDGSVISAEGKQAVATVVASSKDLENAEYEVYGYTDRIGSDAYNQTLSDKRANAVAQELSADGVTSIKTVEGRGKSNPVTGDKCNSVKGRAALIDCLAADRRVEIVVNGDTTSTETVE